LASLGAVAYGLFVLPGHAPAQQPGHDKQVADVEKQIEEVQKRLAELKRGQVAKTGRPIALADILAWSAIRGSALSPDGQWFAYRCGPADGNGEVILRQTKGDKVYKFPAGQVGLSAGPQRPGQAAGPPLVFSHDSRWLAFNTNPPRPGPGFVPTSSPRPKVLLVKVATGEKTEFEGARRFAFSGEAATHLVLHMGLAPAGDSSGSAPASAPATASQAANPGAGDLILRDLANGTELTLGNVAEFAFDKHGHWLALAIDTRDHVSSGVQLRNMDTGALVVLDSGKAVYQNLAWTKKGDGLALLKGVEDKVHENLYSVLGFSQFNTGTPQKVVFDPSSDNAFPAGMTVSPNQAPAWTENLDGILFGIHKIKKKEVKAADKDDTAKTAEAIKIGKGIGVGKGVPKLGMAPGKDKADLVIWHWNDDRLQSQQQVQAPTDRKHSYLAIYRPAQKKFLRLADESLRNVTPAPKERWAIGLDTKPYQLMGTLDGRRYEDVHVIDLQTGARKKVLTKVRWFFGPSHDGSHFLYFDDGHFFTYDIAADKSYNISAATLTSFVNGDDDHNVTKPPTRLIGWSRDCAYLLLSDNWDIWKVPVHGGPGVNLTMDGKKDAIRYRLRLALDPEEKGIDLNAPVYFSMQGEWTKKAGVGRLDPGKTGITRLLWDDAEFASVQKAKGADFFLYTAETFKNYPDYYVTDASFQHGKKITDGVPAQDQFLWSSGARLIDYTSAKGDRLQGVLYLPANYEKGKSYPTIVYIYEKLSQNMHRYQAPTANGFNPAVYTSNGYAVLTPDIKYQINDPGRSAVWCVLPAVEAAVATGVVDKSRVGLHGHSWGGYQTAFLITQTDAFKAAVAGAPLTNLISMYSSIYWNSGTANQPIFESSQGRFTGGYWEDLDAYIRNSPVYHAKNVKTPLMLLHNDKDGAVDWNQGIEYFNTLRRLQKPVVLLQYKGENHGLAKPANKRDYTVRMREFFDHHLMGKPAPAWLKEGVPHLELEDHIKERSKGESVGWVERIREAHQL
jgi:dienelactone hydrolase